MAKKRMDEATKKRIRAARLLQKGDTPAEIARDVGVARQTVYTWKALFEEGGIDALREVRLRGRPGRLDADQLEAVRRAILEKPTEHGFGTELWTLKRVGVVVKRLHGVKYSETQIWRITCLDRTSRPMTPRSGPYTTSTIAPSRIIGHGSYCRSLPTRRRILSTS